MPPSEPPPLQDQASHKDGGDDEAEKNFNLRSLRFWTPVVAVNISVFLVALDRLIIATAIPSITDDFGSIADIGWYGSAYMLACAVFNPLFGRLYQLHPTKWVYLASIALFEAGSALCGAAPTSAAFIAGRAIAGAGAAGVFNGGIMIIIPLVPLRKRPLFTSFFGMASAISSVLGPLIGGSFTDNINLTWRWCFYINLPVGAFTFVAILLFLHIDSPPRKRLSLIEQLQQLDPLGLLFFVPSMVCLILALQWGGTTYAWSAPKVIGLLVTFAITFLIFIAIEAFTPKTALLPSRIVLDRSVAGSLVFMFLCSGAMMAVIYYLSIWFQAVQGESAVEAGIHTIPLVLSFVVFGFAAAIFTQRVGYYVPALLLCPVLCAVGCGMLSTMQPAAGISQWLGYQVIFGLGIGAGFQTATLPPQKVLPRADIAIGMGLVFFMQQLGGSVFVSVGQNVFSQQLVASLSGVKGLDPEALVNTGATELRKTVQPDMLDIVVQAYNHALTRVFVVAAATSAVMIFAALVVKWKSIKPEKSPESKDSAAVSAGGEEEKGLEVDSKA